MKLVDLYIYAFGKLKNENIKFNEGLNVILRENGWGKSTLAVFIKSIFYGLNDSKFSIKENERKRYRPWNFEGKFGGYIVYEKDGAFYRAERLFGSKNSQDEFRLIDCGSGLTVLDNPKSFGEDVFGVDEHVFVRTIFNSQQQFNIGDDSLLDRLSKNLSGDNDDGVEFDKAIKTVNDKAKTYKAERGDKGIITDLKNKLFLLEERIGSLKEVSFNLNVLKNEQHKYEKDIKDIRLELDGLTNQLSEATKVEILHERSVSEIELELSKINVELLELEKMLNGNVISDDEINAYVDCAKDLIDINAMLKNENAKVKRGVNPFLIIILVGIFACVSIIGAFFNLIIMIVGLVLLLITGIVVIVALKSNKNSAKDNNEYIEMQTMYTHKITVFLNKFVFNKSGDFINDLLMLSKIVEKQKILKSRKVQLLKDKEKATSANTQKRSLEIKGKLSEKQREYEFLQEKLQQVRNQIANLIELESKLPDVLVEKENVLSELELAQKEYDVLKITAEYLRKASENIKIKYRKPLEEKLNFYLQLICGKDYLKAEIDVNLNISLAVNGCARESEYFSEGIKDVLNISKRLATAEVLFEGELPFVVLDDPFSNFDETRLSNSLNVIKKLANNRQIIYFTCHSSRLN